MSSQDHGSGERSSRRRSSASSSSSSSASSKSSARSASKGKAAGPLVAMLAVAVVAGFAIGAVTIMLLPSSDGRGRPGAAGAGVEEAYSNGGASGYLAPGAVQPLRLLPGPPAAGSAQDAADRQTFLKTRALSGTPRWSLAQADADQSVPSTLKAFSCALGVDLGPASAPATNAMLERFARDQAPVIEAAKAGFNRSRPFLSNPGEICIPKTDQLMRSPDYPSGHAAWGWAVALLLAEAAPDKADALLARGRVYGESRVVCGAHSASAVDAGRLVGAAMVAAVHAAPDFRSDLLASRVELTSLARSGRTPSAAACAVETQAAKVTP